MPGPVSGLVSVAVGQQKQKNDIKNTRKNHVPVPLLSVNYAVNIFNTIAQVRIEQNYANQESNPIEVVYYFPIEENISVVGFSAKFDDKKMEAVIKEKEVGVEDYKKAVLNKQSGVILEEISPDVLKANIGNLSAGSQCQVAVEYVCEMGFDEGASYFAIPITLQNYKSHGDSISPAPISFAINAISKTVIKEMSSPSHKMIVNIENEKNANNFYHATGKVEVASDDIAGYFGLIIYYENLQDKEASSEKENVETNADMILEKDKTGTVAAMMKMVPTFKMRKQPAEVIFLVDCSDSMDGEDGGSIELAREALQFLLQSLPVKSYFNIIKFGTHFESLYKESQRYTDETVEEARRFSGIKKMLPWMGGTDILKPLDFVFRQPTIDGYARQAFLMTDGEVTNTEACIKLVKNNAKKGRIFTLGIGPTASTHLVNGLARAGEGTALFARKGENLSKKLINQLDNALQPRIEDVNVDWMADEAKENINSKSYNIQAPIKIPALFNGSQLLVYKLYEIEAVIPPKVKITAKIPGGTLDFYVKVDKDSMTKGRAIHQLFTRKLIHYVEKHKLDTKEGAKEMIDFETRAALGNDILPTVKALITELGCKYNVISRFTTFVGIDEKKNISNNVTVTRKVTSHQTQKQKVAKLSISDDESAEDDAETPEAFSKKLRKPIFTEIPQTPKRDDKNDDSPSRKSSIHSRSSLTSFIYSFRKDRRSSTSSDTSFTSYINQTSNESKERASLVAQSSDESLINESATYDAMVSISEDDEVLENAQLPIRKEKSIEIIKLQRSNGSFKRDTDLVNLLKKSFQEIDVEADRIGVDKEIWFTAVVLAFLQNNYKHEMDSLKMIVEKAEDWIQLSGRNAEDLHKKAYMFFKK